MPSASLLLPTSAWDLNYIAVAPWPFGPNSQNPRLVITASEPDTKVTINPNVALGGGTLSGTPVAGTPANTPATYTMQKGDSLTFEQQEELTGSAILSDKPIGLTGASGCINIDACCCDGAHQQIPPVRALGSEYVAVRYRNRVEGKEESPPWRVVGAVDGTVLTYDPPLPAGAMAPATLNQGQAMSFRASGPFIVKSQDADHPFYLAGYMTGAGDFADAGDPEFVNVIPSHQYLTGYTFFADPTYPETNLVLTRKAKADGSFADVSIMESRVLGTADVEVEGATLGGGSAVLARVVDAATIVVTMTDTARRRLLRVREAVQRGDRVGIERVEQAGLPARGECLPQPGQLPRPGGPQRDPPGTGAPDDTPDEQQPGVKHRCGIRTLDVLEEGRIARAGAVVKSEEDDPSPGADRRGLGGDLDPGDPHLATVASAQQVT